LLDHNSYSYEPALPALNKIKSLSIPLVFCSSKTAAELDVFRRELASTDPFISENGGGIHFPAEGKVLTLGLAYAELQAHLLEIQEILKVDVRSMKEMSAVELASMTLLSEEDAFLAQQRNYDLAFVIKGEFDEDLLKREVRCRGLRLTRGARFYHLTGDNDKGRAVRELVGRYESETGREVETVGLGDSENDLPMLEEVDIPVIIPNPGSGAPVHLESPDLIIASSPGPEGWNEVILSLFETDLRGVSLGGRPFHR
jgi:mannosyl-3-phosphoglycerate phosphatase